MTKTEHIQVRIDPETKADAEAVFARLGLKPSDAVRLFYSQVSLTQAIPFDLKIPNAETLEAMEDIKQGRKLVRHKSLEGFKASLRKP